MIDINTKTKNLYKSDSVEKNWFIAFPDLELSFNDSVIIGESAELFESVMEGENIQFVGCMAARFSVTLRISTESADILKNQHIIVSLIPNDTDVDSMVVFDGYVESVEIESNKRNKTITAYDKLYNLSQVDVADWYKALDYPITLKQFRDSLFNYIGVTQETITLPIDDFSIGRLYNPDKIAALDLIKQVCQINCVFGRMNRNGNFEYVVPVGGSSEGVTYYRDASYQEYTVKPVDKLTIKFGEVEGSTGSGTNEYIIQNNIFMNGHTAATLQSVAEAIYPNVRTFRYAPFDINLNGLPYLQCLDRIETTVLNVDNPDQEEWEYKSFLVLSRTMSGMQALKDNASAQGSEDIHKFVSDLNINMDTLEHIVDEIIDDVDNLKLRFYLITNTEDIDIDNNGTQKIVDIDFQAKRNTTVIFQLEALIEVETSVKETTEDNINYINYYDEQLHVIYELNNVEIIDYHPVDIWQDGKHIFHLMKYFSISDTDTTMNLKVYLNSVGGSVHIELNTLKAMLYGQNLIASDKWTGRVEIEEDVEAFELPVMIFGTYTEALSIIKEQPSSDTRTTEDGNTRITENGDTRITEGE